MSDSYGINPETKKRILEFAAENDYRPDFLGQSLRNRCSKTIGVIIPAYNILFYSIAICGIQDYAMKQGYNVMVCHSREQYDVEIRNVEALLAANVDGMIISVAGFTNEPMAELVEPTLTTVRQPIYEIGETAARLLFAQFEDPDLPAELCVMETDIIVRNSTRKPNS